MTEIRQGVEISFLHGPDRIERGVVNGTPWVYWNGREAEARVPVWCHALTNSIDVSGANIVAVNNRDAVAGENIPSDYTPDDPPAPHSVKV